MCGIVGGWTLKRFQQLSERLPIMTNELLHRGPDAEGHWQDSEVGIAFGHRRLAIIGIGAEGAQPMHSESGRYCLTYNGEIYNHLELRRLLVPTGKITWRGQSDTETLLACFEQFGIEETVKLSVGMFAMAAWDRRLQELVLVRDRMGEKPLYYGFIGDCFVFGSELRALTALFDQKPDLNTDALALFLRYGYIPQPYSAYRGIAKLPAGAMLRMNGANLRQQQTPDTQTYWCPDDFLQTANSSGIEAGDAVSRLEALLEQSVKSQMLSEVPLGAFLSGGIDSSAIVALMQKNSMQPVKTFTVGFGEGAFNEAEHAKAVAAHLGTDHTELYVTSQDALDVVPRLPEIYDEPFADSSQIPTFLIARLARTKVAVSLSGDGGDELFLGYGRYPTLVNYWRTFGALPLPLRKLVASCLDSVPMKHWDRFFQLAKPILRRTHYAQANGWRLHRLAGMMTMESPEDCYLEMMSHWNADEALVKGAARLPHEMESDFSGAADGLMRKASLRDIRSYLPDDILVKVDRAAMANSLETRVPLLDHRVVEFALSLPQRIHFREGQSKWPLRQVLYRHVPRMLIDRPKMGFGVPLAEWLRGPLREWAEDMLSEKALSESGMLNTTPIRCLWERHICRQADAHYPLWNVIMLKAWLRKQSGSGVSGR